ncbi:PH domain-containing protein [Tomitella biformata]|uniref:PH domain-containing protein n=1 Tax=Tomitella biformata TaxID=630403 RepID=UPI000463AC6E|nr:PH domain-containing protein [Tomitella biformata]
MTEKQLPDWELEVKPRRVKIVAWLLAIMIVVVFGVLAGLLRITDTGVYFRVWDQLAVAFIGVLIAMAFLLFTRPRLRAGARGVSVRNLFGDKLVEWDLVEALTFPEGAAWARLELPDEEYAPVLAIQIYDRGRAVDAVRDFRAIHAKYAPAAVEPQV